MKLLNAIAVLLFMFHTVTMATEHRPYSVIKKDGDIEIRLYEKIMAAEIRLSGKRKEAAGNAFRPLFRYIRGNNNTDQKISMTAPVAQQLTESNDWAVTFFLPPSIKDNNAPDPIDERVSIHTLPETKIAAITFSGRARQKDLDKNEAKLRTYLNKENIIFITPPIYAFYNAPFTPGFLRRNEVLFKLPPLPTE